MIAYSNGTSTTLMNAFTYIPSSSLTIVKRGFADAGRTQEILDNAAVLLNQQVWWSYVVTNTGEATVTGVAVTDDKLPLATYPGGVVCSGLTILRGASTTCTATATVVP